MSDLQSQQGKTSPETQANSVPEGRAVSGVKVYDRPERKGLSPALLLLIAALLLILGYILYRAWM